MVAHASSAQTRGPAVPTIAELRAARAIRQVHLYELAPKVGLNPGRLGQMLRGRIPMPAAIANRLQEALSEQGP